MRRTTDEEEHFIVELPIVRQVYTNDVFKSGSTGYTFTLTSSIEFITDAPEGEFPTDWEFDKHGGNCGCFMFDFYLHPYAFKVPKDNLGLESRIIPRNQLPISPHLLVDATIFWNCDDEEVVYYKDIDGFLLIAHNKEDYLKRWFTEWKRKPRYFWQVNREIVPANYDEIKDKGFKIPE